MTPTSSFRRPLALLATALTLVLVLAGCGGTEPTAAPLSAQELTFTASQAMALCFVQANAFESQAAIEAAYANVEADSGLRPATIASLKAKAETTPALRASISAQVDAVCGNG